MYTDIKNKQPSNHEAKSARQMSLELESLTTYYYLKCQQGCDDQDPLIRYLQALIAQKCMEYYIPKQSKCTTAISQVSSQSMSSASTPDASSNTTPMHTSTYDG